MSADENLDQVAMDVGDIDCTIIIAQVNAVSEFIIKGVNLRSHTFVNSGNLVHSRLLWQS